MAVLSKLNTKKKAEAGVEIELHLPGDPTNYQGLFVKIAGPGSTIANRVAKAMTDLEREAQRHRREIKVDDDRYIEIVSDLIMDWRDFEEVDESGKVVPLPFTRANLFAAIKEYPWIIDQVFDAMKDTKLFI